MTKMVFRAPEDAGAEADYQSIVTQMVAAVSRDHTQLRMFVYEFARRNLRKSLYRHFQDGEWSYIAEQIRALESAIDRVEANFAAEAAQLPGHSERSAGEPSTNSSLLPLIDSKQALLADQSTDRVSILAPLPSYDSAFPPNRWAEPSRHNRSALARLNEKLQSNFWWTIQLIAAVVVGVAIYAAIDGQTALALLGLRPLQPINVSVTAAHNGETIASVASKDTALEPKSRLRTGVPDLPLPADYGVYAISNGRLIALDSFPIRIPDARVAISALISTPSRARLPSGQVQFVVFRRGLMSDAPDRVSLRVVAQIVRSLTFDSGGKAVMTDVKEQWVVRSNSYEMKVAPVADNPEMIVIRPEQTDLALPAGRYALVLKNGAYDFTVDGRTTDGAHCLERTDALNAPVYTECPNP